MHSGNNEHNDRMHASHSKKSRADTKAMVGRVTGRNLNSGLDCHSQPQNRAHGRFHPCKFVCTVSRE